MRLLPYFTTICESLSLSGSVIEKVSASQSKLTAGGCVMSAGTDYNTAEVGGLVWSGRGDSFMDCNFCLPTGTNVLLAVCDFDSFLCEMSSL